MKAKIIVALVILMVFTSALFAYEVPLVDIKTAQEEVDKKTKENEEMSKKVEELKARNTELESKIEDAEKKVSELSPVLERARRKGQDLYKVFATVKDDEVRSSTKETIDKNNELKQNLQKLRSQLSENIEKYSDEREENIRQIEVLNARMSRNEDAITLLQASIDKTSKQKKELESYVQDVEKYLQESQTLLNELDTEKGSSSTAPSGGGEAGK